MVRLDTTFAHDFTLFGDTAFSFGATLDGDDRITPDRDGGW
jgi:hypothetical protein